MQFRRKFVSASILAAILSVPLFALAACTPESAGMMQCPPDCPMMARMSVGHDTSEMRSKDSGSCCQFKSSRPAPVAESSTVSPIVSIEPIAVSIGLVATQRDRLSVSVDTSPPLLLDSQAQLCTFLI